MIYLSQPKSKNTLRVLQKIISFLQPLTRNPPVVLFSAILTVSRFQFIKPFYTGVHLPTPPLSTTTVSCNLLPRAAYWQLLVLQLLYHKGSHWWFTPQGISSDLMTHFCRPTCSQAQLCLPIRGWVPSGEQEQISLIPVFRRGTTSCWEWILMFSYFWK